MRTYQMQPNTSTRLLSLDVFRGLTIAIMILVNSPGNRVAYHCLEHSSWDGCTLADLVFPFFIVIVGISSVLALTHLKTKGLSNWQLLIKLGKRSLYIFFLGILLNVLPNHFDPSHLRVMGVLQRIALCYLSSSVLFLTTTMKTQVFIIGILLVGYWLLLINFPATDPLSLQTNIVGYWDKLFFSSQHLYTPMFDPEGLLSTLPAIASALFGNIAGYCLISSRTKAQKLQWMVCTGLLLMVLGWLWGIVFPFNKSLWTSSYVLWTSGLSFIALSLCFMLIEIKPPGKWAKPFLLFGKNSLLVYVLHVIFLKLQAVVLLHNATGEVINLRLYITEFLFSHFSPKNASFSYAILYTLFWLAVLAYLTRRRIRKQNQYAIKA
ncbi:acyltransferase family protein [Legionella septentrionalis]|uniref:DUF1624 domain-containing protein n=1 Tax=Legionella septentrionalis TaxID=2498109 RepID=A0A433JHJ5_9GAMM|nr:heparan-alpha-glucosaminide N-acetyltransferase domain-containing protein [Legionella septentrionalis]RUQ81889.1 DUF1624 domain-containing protein [Legionella septentrionalis]RUR00259.1 DUF1624 domain-containing protein [Legionella septentrionalis]